MGNFLNQIREVSYPETEGISNLKKHIGNVAGNGQTETTIGSSFNSNFFCDSLEMLNECVKFLRNEGFNIIQIGNVEYRISW